MQGDRAKEIARESEIASEVTHWCIFLTPKMRKKTCQVVDKQQTVQSRPITEFAASSGFGFDSAAAAAAARLTPPGFRVPT